MQGLKETTMLKNEKQILTELYNNLKSMYEEILNREPQLQIEGNNKPVVQKLVSAMTA